MMRIKEMIEESIGVKQKVVDGLVPHINGMAELIIDAFRNGKRVYICGNGGSACDSMHFAEELVARYRKDRKALPALSLTDSPTITCAANDFGYDTVFSRQVEAFGRKDDILVAISTSGNSGNVIKAVQKAEEIGMKTIFLGGNDGGKMKGMCDLEIIVPSGNSARVQESHITIIHCICELIEESLND